MVSKQQIAKQQIAKQQIAKQRIERVDEMKITMAHGSGGKASAELMTSIFEKHFKNDVLEKLEDAAVIEVSGRIAYSTDSFVVTPVIFKGGDIGKLCVCGTVNDLLMMGAQPKYLTCGFILEEGLSLETLDQIVESMARQAEVAGVKIVAGDTKVIEGSGGLYINTSGIGIIPEGRDISAANCMHGDAVILSGNLGDHHACILSSRMGIENNIQSDCACLADITNVLFDADINVKAMRDVTRGGLGTVLNELADNSGCCIEIQETSMPISDDVQGFCDILGLDPIYMGNEGKMIAVIAAEDAQKALTLIKSTEHGKDAAAIGVCKKGKGVVMVTRIGGSRVVDVLYGEGLPRIC